MAGRKKVAVEVVEEPKKKAGRKPATKKAVKEEIIDTEAKIEDIAEEISEDPEEAVVTDIDKSIRDKKIDRFVRKYSVLGIEREVIEEKYDAVIDLFSDMVPDDFKEYLPDIIFAAADKAVVAGLHFYTRSLKDRKKRNTELSDDERIEVLKQTTQSRIDKRKEREKKYEERLKARQERLIAKIKGKEVEEAVV